jgi:hypothetical protein
LGAATISQISVPLGVTCGEKLGPVFFDVRIHANKTPHTQCRYYYQLQGSTVRFTASVENLIAAGEVTDTRFNWTVPAGVTVNGPSDHATIEVVLNTHGSVSLTCQGIITTTVQTGTNYSTADFVVSTVDEVLLYEAICHFQSVVAPLPKIPGPGGDPAVLGRPYFLDELHQVRAAAERSARAAAELAKQATVVIEQREAPARLPRGQERR